MFQPFFLYLFFRKAGVLTLALLFSVFSQTAIAHGKITGFNLSSCGAKNCVMIEAETATMGFVPSSYAFATAIIKISDKRTNNLKLIDAEDIYLDGNSNKIFIRKLVHLKEVEAIYDFETETLSLYQINK